MNYIAFTCILVCNRRRSFTFSHFFLLSVSHARAFFAMPSITRGIGGDGGGGASSNGIYIMRSSHVASNTDRQ